jgi:hypothetical protein
MLKKLLYFCIVVLLWSHLSGHANDLSRQGQSSHTPDKATAANADTWSGTYRMEPGSKDNAGPIGVATYVISKAPDLVAKNAAYRYESDLTRWSMRLQEGSKNDTSQLRRFLTTEDRNGNEYEQFGWKEMHAAKKIECLDGGNFFFCRTEPNTHVRFSKSESYHTKSGIFGILLHAGVFELYKLPG